MAYKGKYKGSEIDAYLTKAKEMSETYPENVVQIEENTKDIFFLKGADQKEIADTLTWKGGQRLTDGTIRNNDAYGTNWKNAEVSVGAYDSVVYSGLTTTQTAENRAVNVVADGVIVKNIPATSGEIICSDYNFNESLVLQITADTSKLESVSVRVSIEGNAALKEEFKNLDGRVSAIEPNAIKLADDIYGVDGKEIANSLTWNTGYWDTSGGIVDSYANATYNRRTTIDMTYIDKVVYSGLMPGNYQTSTNRAVNVVADGIIVKVLSATSGELLRKNYPFKESLVLQISTRTDKLNDVSIVITAESKFAYKRSLDKSNKNIETLNDIVVGCVNKEIISDAIWEKGLWSYTNDKGAGSYDEMQRYRYSNKIDISLYDSVILSGLARIAHLSSSSDLKAAVAIYGDGQKAKMVECSANGAIVNIYRADYAQYNKLEIVVNAFQSEETYVPSILVSKEGLEKEKHSTAKRIVLCGDSLMGNDSSLIHYEFKQIAKSQGYEIVRNSMGGENIIGNLTRNGGIAMRTTTEFTIPASGSAVVELGSAWMKSTGEYAALPSSITSVSVVINNIEGVITRNTDGTYTFARKEEGEAIKVGAGVIFCDKTLWTCRDYPHVWFTGQNGGYENEADWADMINSAARNFGENFIVCSTALERTTNELVRQATKTFGDKYINLRAYTQGQAVYDGQRYGLIDSSYTAADYEALFWPGSDKVHQNNLLSYIWAVLMWNTLLDLGYVEGERIDTGEYYLE